MPSGKTHNKVNFIFLPVFLIVLMVIGFTTFKYALFFSIGYLFGTLYLDPDLDIKGKSFKRWGIFNFIWSPYQKIFPHRSIFTHGWLLGDLVRITYLVLWLYMLFCLPSILLLHIVLPIYYKYLLGHTTVLFVCVSIVVILLYLLIARIKKAQIFVAVCIVAIVTFICTLLKFSIFTWIQSYFYKEPYVFYYWGIGVVMSSSLHIISDITVSSIKKLLK
ncbi:metal-binding protein [Priestia filamentosa]|uniref:metal-binding protein n=1 Tax=Priestia filamentosa TaxID=1402861 RepID=UPI00068FE7DF